MTTPPMGLAHAGRLIPIFAGETGLPCAQVALAIARAAARQGDKVLVIDSPDNQIISSIETPIKATLSDVIDNAAHLHDAKYISHEDTLTLCPSGHAPLVELLGAMAAISLTYDWVFVLPQAGCTPAHVRLAAAADQSIMMFDGNGDRFMRAYWMLDAIRMRAPKCDPLMLAYGPASLSSEAYEMFASTVREFLGAPPSLASLIENKNVTPEIAETILAALANDLEGRKAA